VNVQRYGVTGIETLVAERGAEAETVQILEWIERLGAVGRADIVRSVLAPVAVPVESQQLAVPGRDEPIGTARRLGAGPGHGAADVPRDRDEQIGLSRQDERGVVKIRPSARLADRERESLVVVLQLESIDPGGFALDDELAGVPLQCLEQPGRRCFGRDDAVVHPHRFLRRQSAALTWRLRAAEDTARRRVTGPSRAPRCERRFGRVVTLYLRARRRPSPMSGDRRCISHRALHLTPTQYRPPAPRGMRACDRSWSSPS
jgi:hypothetical protein